MDTSIHSLIAYKWIQNLSNPLWRELSLTELRYKDIVPDLASLIWHSFGTVTILLKEIMQVYPFVCSEKLSAQQSSRVSKALSLLQCCASDPEIRPSFIKAHIPLYLYPLLHSARHSKSKDTTPTDCLRLMSLGVIGSLVKNDDDEVIQFLITSGIIPLCLRIMETGSELPKAVAIYILLKILLKNEGLSYICQTYDRFSEVAMVLGNMVIAMEKNPSERILKHVIRCYLRLSDNPRAKEALHLCLPDQLRDMGVSKNSEEGVKAWHKDLLKLYNISGFKPLKRAEKTCVVT